MAFTNVYHSLLANSLPVKTAHAQTLVFDITTSLPLLYLSQPPLSLFQTASRGAAVCELRLCAGRRELRAASAGSRPHSKGQFGKRCLYQRKWKHKCGRSLLRLAGCRQLLGLFIIYLFIHFFEERGRFLLPCALDDTHRLPDVPPFVLTSFT